MHGERLVLLLAPVRLWTQDDGLNRRVDQSGSTPSCGPTRPSP